MQLVYMPGVWDLLHVGHVIALTRASALGDKLIVGVPTDDIVRADKGQPPIIPATQRLMMVLALTCVDAAFLYESLNFLPHLEMFKPDVFAVGSTWGNAERHRAAEHWVDINEKRMVRIPYSTGVSTTKIIDRIKDAR